MVSYESLHIKPLATELFLKQLILAIIKETSELYITGPLGGESTSNQWIPLTQDQ